MPEPFLVPPDRARRPLKVVGEEITVLASGAQTSSYEIFRQAGPEGSGPPPHSHPWDESFYVLEGDIAFGIDSQEAIAGPTLVHLPAGTTHWFRFGRGGGVMISMTSREGASLMFADFDREISPGQSRPVQAPRAWTALRAGSRGSGILIATGHLSTTGQRRHLGGLTAATRRGGRTISSNAEMPGVTDTGPGVATLRS